MKRFRFMPTEENFFELFEEIAQALVEAAKVLHELITNYEDIEHKTHLLREMEKRIDRATGGICDRLNISFVTPIDREDIHNLAVSMDEVLDYIEASADRMKLYGVEDPAAEVPETAEISAILVQATEQIQIGIKALSNLRQIDQVLNPCVRINELENDADKLLRKALNRLFKEKTRPLDIVKWQEIIYRLELATDKCEDVANVLESIVVKNA
ncbi:MAG: DUF47 family protein [Armatimonadota bacterium]|nr:DUF47 family protein [Armatimonadota bacterium]